MSNRICWFSPLQHISMKSKYFICRNDGVFLQIFNFVIKAMCVCTPLLPPPHWLVLCRLDTNYSILKEGTLTEKMFPSDWPVRKPVVTFLNQWLMSKGGAAPSQAVLLDAVGTQAEQTTRATGWAASIPPPSLHQPDLTSHMGSSEEANPSSLACF